MSNLREAAQQALEALENHTAIKHPQQRSYRDAAITALRAALAEPVCNCDMRTRLVGDGCEVCNPERAQDLEEPVQEPLTDEEMKRVCAETWSFDPYEIARAIEEAHGIIP